jgi:hypothetical protein
MSPEVESGSPRRVLVVDDEPDIPGEGGPGPSSLLRSGAKTHAECPICRATAIPIARVVDGVQMPDALAGVVGGRDETDRGAVVDAEAFTVEAIRQQPVGGQRVLQGERAPPSRS